MPLRARIPSDPLIRLIFELNRTERPEWEASYQKMDDEKRDRVEGKPRKRKRKGIWPWDW
jgi:hypothetical protein